MRFVSHFYPQVAPFLQGVHFFYGFGAFISPLVARPFLRPGCTFSLNTTHYVFNATKNSTFDNSSGLWYYNTLEEVPDTTSDICFAYWVISVSHVSKRFLCLPRQIYFFIHLNNSYFIIFHHFSSLCVHAA